MRKLAVVMVVLAYGARAEARVFTSASDPSLSGAAMTDLHNMSAPSDKNNFPLAFGSGDSSVIVTVTAPAGGSGAIDCSTPPNCELSVWDGYPVTMAFDRSVSAVGGALFCMGTVSVHVVGSTGSETFSPCSAPFWGVADIGDTTSVQLSVTNYFAGMDSLYVGLPPSTASPTPSPSTSPSPGSADLTVAFSGPSPAAVGPGQPLTVTLTAQNLGDGVATAVSLVDILPEGAQLLSAQPMCTDSMGDETWALASLDGGAAAGSFSLTMTTPPFEHYACHDTLVNLAVIDSATHEANVSNNIALQAVEFDNNDPNLRENCLNWVDDDCNGLIDCLDPACSAATCVIDYLTPAHGGDPGPLPPLIPLPLADPSQMPPLPYLDWQNPPSLPPPCVKMVHGAPVDFPSDCCDPAAPVGVDEVMWELQCTPKDPNSIEATPLTNVLGYGWTTSGDTIRYTIHYENIGSVDAHGVEIIDPLPAGVDEATLAIENGGAFDPTLRALTWIDTVVFPHDPRTVAFSVKVKAVAPAHLRNHAVIVFPTRCRPPASTPTRSST